MASLLPKKSRKAFKEKSLSFTVVDRPYYSSIVKKKINSRRIRQRRRYRTLRYRFPKRKNSPAFLTASVASSACIARNCFLAEFRSLPASRRPCCA
jgi:hypothetical protein